MSHIEKSMELVKMAVRIILEQNDDLTKAFIKSLKDNGKFEIVCGEYAGYLLSLKVCEEEKRTDENKK